MQINLIVGDILKLKGFFIAIIDEALEVVKWFNSHSQALGLLQSVQLHKLGKILALILPVLTRWTSHYLSVRRLIDLEVAFKQVLLDHTPELIVAAGPKRAAKEKAQEVLSILKGHGFWTKLKQ